MPSAHPCILWELKRTLLTKSFLVKHTLTFQRARLLITKHSDDRRESLVPVAVLQASIKAVARRRASGPVWMKGSMCNAPDRAEERRDGVEQRRPGRPAEREREASWAVTAICWRPTSSQEGFCRRRRSRRGCGSTPVGLMKVNERAVASFVGRAATTSGNQKAQVG